MVLIYFWRSVCVSETPNIRKKEKILVESKIKLLVFSMNKDISVERVFSELALCRRIHSLIIGYLVALDLTAPTGDDLYEKLQSKRFEQTDIPSSPVDVVSFVKQRIQHALHQQGMHRTVPHLQFGLSTQDVWNIVIPSSVSEFFTNELKHQLETLISVLTDKSYEWQVPLITIDGAVSTVGYVYLEFTERLQRQIARFDETSLTIRYGCGVGKHTPLTVVYPQIDWVGFAKEFCKDTLSMEPEHCVVQGASSDSLAHTLNMLKHTCLILVDLVTETLHLQNTGVFLWDKDLSEPLENTKKDLEQSAALLGHQSDLLTCSRQGRQWGTSALFQAIGEALNYMMRGLKTTESVVNALVVVTSRSIEEHVRYWEVVYTPYLLILQRNGCAAPESLLHEMKTRGRRGLTRQDVVTLIGGLPVSESVKVELLGFEPRQFIPALPALGVDWRMPQ